jgi:hypothetical protein
MPKTKYIVPMIFAAMFVFSAVPHSYADIASVDIQKPTYLDHKYKSDPYLCVYSDNPRDLKIAQTAIVTGRIILEITPKTITLGI